MSYKIKETYLTIQGEGAHAGRVAIFCRFTGCNLWSGHEKDREDATCKFCDTDFVGTDGVGVERLKIINSYHIIFYLFGIPMVNLSLFLQEGSPYSNWIKS